MRLLIIDHLSNAYESLRANRTRTFLTSLGVTIGVASVTAVLSLGAGASHTVQKQIAALDGNIAVIRPLSQAEGNITQQQNFMSSTLSSADYEAVRQIAGVTQAAPLMVFGGTTTGAKDQATQTSLVATTPDLQDIAGLTVREGQFIDDGTDEHTAVVGQQLSVDLFGTDQSIGQTFKVRGTSFTVIGVLKRQNNPVNFNTVDFDNAAIIHIAAGETVLNNDQVQQIDIRAKGAAELPAVISRIDRKLRSLHNDEKDYTIITGNDIAEPTNRLFDLVRGVTVAVAGISLVVGGIGIMNIMLVSVAERTREIGLRKAVGASNSHIIWQFIVESLIISLVGGVCGYLIGYLLAFAVSTFVTFGPVFTYEIFGTALGLSLLVGLVFGIYPALRAARKDPIESLRNYH